MEAIRLSSEQVSQYWEDGYIRLGRIFDDEALAALQQEEARFRRYPQISLADGKSILEDSSTIFRNQLANYSTVVRDILLHGPHIDAVQQLVGENVCAFFNQFVTKFPDADQNTAEFPWHQDNGYGGRDILSDITVWCALDDVDTDNGCVWIVPGSHKLGLLPHGESGKSWHKLAQAPNDGIAAVLKAGEAVAFNGLTLHRSLANHSPHARRAFFMSYGDYAERFGADELVTKPLYMVRGQLPYPVQEVAAV